MPRKKDWREEQDEDFVKKLRSASRRLPTEVADGLKNLGHLARTSTPNRDRPAAATNLQPEQDAAFNQHQLSDDKESFSDYLENINSSLDSNQETKLQPDSFWSFYDPDLTMAAKTTTSVEGLQATIESLLEEVKTQKRINDEHERKSELYEKKIIGLEKVKVEVTDEKTEETKPDLEALIYALRKDYRTLYSRMTENEQLREDKGATDEKGKENLLFRRHTEALRHLGRKPEVFEKPTMMRTAKDFIKEYMVYAKTIANDKDYWFDGVAQFLKGESKIYFDSYLAINGDSARHIDAFAEKFLVRFKRVTLDEMKKGASQRKQGIDESVRDYGVEMTRLMGRMNVDEEFKLEFLITNMLPELQEPVLASYPTSVEGALIEGERQEAILRSVRKVRAAEKAADTSDVEREARLNALETKLTGRKVEFSDRGRERNRRESKFNPKYDKHRSASSEHRSASRGSSYRSGSESSRSGREGSKSPSRPNRDYSRDNYNNKKPYNSEKSYGSGKSYNKGNSKPYKDNDKYSKSHKGSDKSKSHKYSNKEERKDLN
jgi:hypothetical protein